MDPITATIVAGVLWFFLGSAGSIIIYLVVLGAAGLISVKTESEWPVVVSIPLAMLLAAVWEVVVIIQVILHIVNLVQLVSVGA